MAMDGKTTDERPVVSLTKFLRWFSGDCPLVSKLETLEKDLETYIDSLEDRVRSQNKEIGYLSKENNSLEKTLRKIKASYSSSLPKDVKTSLQVEKLEGNAIEIPYLVSVPSIDEEFFNDLQVRRISTEMVAAAEMWSKDSEVCLEIAKQDHELAHALCRKQAKAVNKHVYKTLMKSLGWN